MRHPPAAPRGLGALLALLLFPGGALGAWHVAPGGSDDSGDGTAGKPWRTVGYALGAIPGDAGGELRLAEGDYPAFETTRAFTAPILIAGAQSGTSPLSRIAGTSVLSGASGLRLQGLLLGGDSAGTGLRLAGGTSLSEIVRCRVVGALELIGAERVRVEDTPAGVIRVLGGHDLVLRRVVAGGLAVGEGARALVVDAAVLAGTVVLQGTGPVRDVWILNSLLAPPAGSVALSLDGTLGLLISNAVIWNPSLASAAVSVAGGAPTGAIVNTVIASADGTLPAVYGPAGASAGGLVLRSNVYFNAEAALPSGGFHVPGDEPGGQVVDPAFEAPATTGSPTLAWLDGFGPRTGSPLVDAGLDVGALALPTGLSGLLAAYGRGGAAEPWWSAVSPGWTDAFGASRPQGSGWDVGLAEGVGAPDIAEPTLSAGDLTIGEFSVHVVSDEVVGGAGSVPALLAPPKHDEATCGAGGGRPAPAVGTSLALMLLLFGALRHHGRRRPSRAKLRE